MPTRASWAALALVVVGCIAPIWWAALLPAQDLPVHLAYARIIGDDSDPLGQQFQAVSSFQPYFSTYYFLTSVGRLTSLLGAARLLFTLYVLALFGAMYLLARAAHPDEPRDRPPAAVFLVAPLVWNPVVAKGFLSFLVAMPLVVLAAALVLMAKTRPRLSLLGLTFTLAAAASLHVYAAGCAMLVVTLLAAFDRKRRTLIAALLADAAAAVTTFIWRLVGEVGIGDKPVAWSSALREAVGFDVVTDALHVNWGTPPLKLTYALYTLLGPWGPLGQLVTFVALVVVIAVCVRSGGRLASCPCPALRAALAFAGIAFLLPWGIELPSQFGFIDLRTMTVAALLVAGLVPPRFFGHDRARIALVGFALLACVQLQQKFASFSKEGQSVVRLLRQTGRSQGLLFLALDGEASGWGRAFQLTRHLPFLHTALNGGVNLQLWDRYASHLPVEYRPGRKPSALSVWKPADFELGHLDGAQALLVQEPAPDGPGPNILLFNKLPSQLQGRFRGPTCDGAWCLYLR